MEGNSFRFSVREEVQPGTKLDELFETLRRRGAFFSYEYNIHRYGQTVVGYRMLVPLQFPWEPFIETLRESELLHGLGEEPVDRRAGHGQV